MAAVIYSLCTLTCLVCVALLFRGYRATRSRLLFWSALCFAGLTANNALLIIDRLIFPQVDLYPLRLMVALVAFLLMIVGLVWERD